MTSSCCFIELYFFFVVNQWEVNGVAERIMETVEWRIDFGLPKFSESLVR